MESDVKKDQCGDINGLLLHLKKEPNDIVKKTYNKMYPQKLTRQTLGIAGLFRVPSLPCTSLYRIFAKIEVQTRMCQ